MTFIALNSILIFEVGGVHGPRCYHLEYFIGTFQSIMTFRYHNTRAVTRSHHSPEVELYATINYSR